MSSIAPTRDNYSNFFDCFNCHRQSACRCFTVKCGLNPIEHLYCHSCAEVYKKRPEGNCPGCAAARAAMERDEASRPSGEKTTIIVDGLGRPVCDLSKTKKE